MNVIILLGAPGSGKGTTAERLRDATGYVHISTGDMLRAAVKKGSEVGLEADAYMKRGALVPDDLMIRIVEERLDAGGDDESWMFDGYPRTVAQADLLEQSLARRGGKIDRVFLLDAPREVLIARLTGRRICRQCGRNFHILNIPPAREGICDGCGGELYQRPDDHEETIVNRLDVYANQTESLIAHYREQGTLVRVDSTQGADELAAEVRGYLTSGD